MSCWGSGIQLASNADGPPPGLMFAKGPARCLAAHARTKKHTQNLHRYTYPQPQTDTKHICVSDLIRIPSCGNCSTQSELMNSAVGSCSLLQRKMKVVILSDSEKKKVRTPASPHNSLPSELEHELLKQVRRSNRFHISLWLGHSVAGWEV